MQIRTARVSDVESICALISEYAELDRMLFRSPAEIYENIQQFKVADESGLVAGCCALQVVWSDLAEIKSLAVRRDRSGRGAGRALVEACVGQARDLGVRRIFVLTMEPEFFRKVGFSHIGKETLPMKVWSDCARCCKQDQCDEVAMVRDL